MKYILSKDNARPEIDEKLKVLKEVWCYTREREPLEIDKPFTMMSCSDVNKLYTYCFKHGYILNKAFTV